MHSFKGAVTIRVNLSVRIGDPAVRGGFRDLLARAIPFVPDRARPIDRSQEVVCQSLDAARVSKVPERGALDVLKQPRGHGVKALTVHGHTHSVKPLVRRLVFFCHGGAGPVVVY